VCSYGVQFGKGMDRELCVIVMGRAIGKLTA